MAWQPPVKLLPLDELNDAVAHLEARLVPASLQDFQTCMAAMLNMLALPKDDAGLSWETRLGIYFTALADVPPDLLEQASLRCIKAEKWFPKVALIREQIEAEFKLRRNMLARARWLVANRTKAKPISVFVPEPEDVRLRGWIERWKRNGDHFFAGHLKSDAMAAEVRLAEIEGRAPEDWALEQATKRLPPSKDQPPGHTAPATIEGDFTRQEECPSHDFVGGMCRCGARQIDGFDSEEQPPGDASTRDALANEPPPRAGEDLEW